nr:hypothetical protein [Tanacetum cinerariifolium]
MVDLPAPLVTVLDRVLADACSPPLESTILKRRQEDDDQEAPSAGLDRGSKRQKEGDVYSKRRIIDVTELKIVEWHDYKHLDRISVCRDDDQIYKFKEGDFKRLRLQDIEDMLLLLEHCHPEASGRSSTGSGKLPEEAQPYEA